MIKIPCQCGHLFELGDDQAGALVQCPQCRRLNEIPSLDDLPFITQDGTYDMTETPQEPEKDRAAKLVRAFSRDKVDETGEEIDLRSTPDEMLDAGEEIPLADEQPIKPAAPKYDPETGELVRPIGVSGESSDAAGSGNPSPASVPMATPALNYESAYERTHFSAARIFIEPFMPLNAFVMFFILLAHGLMELVLIVTLGGFFIVAPAWFVLILGLGAHWGNIIDDIGPSEHDELPRPLRNLGFREDLWDPFSHMGISLSVCYGLAVAALVRVPEFGVAAIGAALGLAALGTLVFPAVLLTASTSGSLTNLRPDRVFGTIRVWSAGYLLALILWVAAAATYGTGLVLTVLQAFAIFGVQVPKVLVHPVVVYGTLFLGIYLMHVFCWYLGLAYRAHHKQFPWELQAHTPRSERMAEFYEAKRRARQARIAAAKARAAAAAGTAARTPPTASRPIPQHQPQRPHP